MSLDLTMHRQWSSRPADETFADLASLATHLEAVERRTAARPMSFADLKIQPAGDDLQLVGPNGHPATFTHWSFRQLAGLAQAPASYLQQLPSNLAADALNWSMQNAERALETDRVRLLLQAGTDATGETDPHQLTVRAVNGKIYTRVPTAQIVRRLEALTGGTSWRAPMVYAGGDFGAQLQPVVGYAGDRDAYVCLVDSERTITNPTNPTQELWRGVMVLNSEVGARGLKIVCFLCEKVCANFMIWGYQQLAAFDRRHVGRSVHQWQQELPTTINTLRQLPAATEENVLRRAATQELAPDKAGVIDLVRVKTGIPAATATTAYETAIEYDQNPRSVWGYTHGLTRVSQATGYRDQRHELDRAAAKLMQLAA
jgi:hypothetical protein